YPAQIAFSGPRDEQRLIVMGVWADGVKWDLSRAATFATAQAQTATVDATGTVHPAGNGTTTITVSYQGVSARVPVSVKNATADQPVNFTTEVVPIFTRFGCNSGGCHGASLGRGGFRLSLFGFDPEFDYEQIVRSNEGRRVVVSDPERSILLAKPALVMEHGGGEKLKLNSRDYLRLRTWLEDGAPGPNPSDPEVTRIEVFPHARVLAPGEQQQLAVTATWSDGRIEDVTHLTQFDSLNDAVAATNPSGLVTARSAGETHVMARFSGQAVVASFTLPYAKIDHYPTLPANNFIDERLIAKWKELGITPSPLASDSDFLRRLYLDAIGTLPTAEEVRAFVQDQNPQKRAKAVDAALSRPEFVDWWALKWGDLLRIDRQPLQDKGMWSFHNWLRGQLRDGVPIDAFVRDIVTAEGSTFTNGPANFYKIGRNADDWAETTSQVFLGVRVQCAKCHTHPFEKWTQTDYYGMSAFFIRLGTKNSTEFGLFGRESVVFLRPGGEARHPRKGVTVKPKPFDGPTMEDEFDRRQKLADWITAPDNPFFARNIVNRFWGYLMGRGLVEPLDDMRATNPASNPELLDALAKDFVQHKFDQKHLMRMIFNSRAYQLSSQVTPGNAADGANTHFSRYTIKRLTAEQLADALDYATATREKYKGVPLGTRAIQLPDTSYASYLMDTFGRPPRQVVCECERTTKPNIAQALHLLNGDFLNNKIAGKSGRVAKLVQSKTPADQAVKELYLVTLSREPSPDELAKATGWVKSAGSMADGLQDLLWVLINSKEFLFVH
ncbi:MAG: DUF1553 domain-containing protein, partial [Bacteroidales bacterium]|nr:DUF1553 domain-containing protein [Bacteroidales bacterium]